MSRETKVEPGTIREIQALAQTSGKCSKHGQRESLPRGGLSLSALAA